MASLISIILPVFNGEAYMEQAIESCLSQSHTNLELIIVNDASTDASQLIAEEFAARDNRIRIKNNQNNKKLPASLNIGHRLARGEFVTWISHDNFFAPTALENMMISLQQSKADIVFADFIIINERGKEMYSYKFNKESSILLENNIRACFLYKMDVFNKNNGYDEELFKIEDYAFWLMASSNSVIQHIPKELYYYRKHPESLTAKKTISLFKYEKDYIRKVEKMYFKFFQKWGIHSSAEIAKKFSRLHLHQEIDVLSFLKNYDSLKIELEEILYQYDMKRLLRDIDVRIRANILRSESNQNLATLVSVIRKRPQLLYLYSGKKTIKIIGKSLF